MRRAKKGIKAHRAKLPTPTRAIDALRGAEKKNRIKNRRKNKGAGPQPSYLGPFGHLLQPAWIIRRAYSEILSPEG